MYLNLGFPLRLKHPRASVNSRQIKRLSSSPKHISRPYTTDSNLLIPSK
ncbi:hypothetical protein DSUL_50247 [Desulfovibrionales bacterium]